MCMHHVPWYARSAEERGQISVYTGVSLCCCRSNKVKGFTFKPRGPLDVAALFACGVVALYARGTEACGNAVDEAILGTPLGQHSCLP